MQTMQSNSQAGPSGATSAGRFDNGTVNLYVTGIPASTSKDALKSLFLP
jgi:hypothetical protein